MTKYLLLRDNKESGPYSFDDLKQKGLKAYDLVWVEGKSAAWRYPSEVEELRSFAPVVEEQPFDRFYKKPSQAPVSAPAAAQVSAIAGTSQNSRPVTISTNNTGFPGETDADHAATLDFIAARPFTYLHVFSYSQRPGTKAASLPGQLPGHIIKTRARALRSLADSKSAAFRRSQIGRTLRVLTLRRDLADDSGSTPALSENYLQVSLPVEMPPNQFLDATVTHLDDKHLLAEPVESAALSAT